MKYRIVSVFDTRLRIFMPFNCVNDITDEDLIESHRRAVLMGKIPANLAENYDLYDFGKFDDKEGEIELNKKPVFLVSLADFVSKKQVVMEDKEDVNSVQG